MDENLNLENLEDAVEAVADDGPPLFDVAVDHGSEPWWRRVARPDGPSRVVTAHFAWRRIFPGADTFAARLADGALLATIVAPQSPDHGWRWYVSVHPGRHAARGALIAADAAASVSGEAATYAAASAAIRAAVGAFGPAEEGPEG